MSNVESTQVQLMLVDPGYVYTTSEGDEITGKQILNQLRLHKGLQKDTAGEFVIMRFNSQPFKFRPGVPLTVPASVASRLREDSAILVGPSKDALTNPFAPFLTEINRYQYGEEMGTPVISSPTICVVCREDLKTLPRLARHWDKHKKSHPDLFGEKTTPDHSELEMDGADETVAVPAGASVE